MTTTADDITAGIRVLDEVIREAATYLNGMFPVDGDLVDVIRRDIPGTLTKEDEAALRKVLALA